MHIKKVVCLVFWNMNVSINDLWAVPTVALVVDGTGEHLSYSTFSLQGVAVLYYYFPR